MVLCKSTTIWQPGWNSNRLKEEMKSKDITQTQIAKDEGYKYPSAVSNVVHGWTETLKLRIAIAKRIGMEANEIWILH